MHIELTEFLRCPERHEPELPCVLVPETMAGRDVVAGVVACPVCRRAYAIRDSVVVFGPDDGGVPPAGDTALDPDVVRALLGLSGPGGHVVLIGSAVALAAELSAAMGGIHFVGVNAPRGVAPSATLSLVRHPERLPLTDGMARGVVMGAETCHAPWLEEAVRVLLRGLRLVAESPSVTVSGVEPMATGRGLWVGRKR